jgi:hypothetical protein
MVQQSTPNTTTADVDSNDLAEIICEGVIVCGSLNVVLQ